MKEQRKHKIDPESPKSYRCIDKTPGALAKELDLPINTVRNRLDQAGINFDVILQDQKRKQHQTNQPQVYYYEGLPILSVYIKRRGIKRTTRRNRNNLYSFMSQLEKYLDDHTEQTFCRNFLYTQEEYQRYLFETYLQSMVADRLHCIERLSQGFVLSPKHLADFGYLSLLPDILDQLDQLILELANYTDFDLLTQISTLKDLQNVDDGLEQGPVDKIVEKWYTSLQKNRERISNEGCIELPVPLGADSEQLRKALNERLFNETISKEDKQRIRDVGKILSYVNQSQCSLKEVRCAIRALMDYNKDLFLQAVFSVSPADGFRYPETCNKEISKNLPYGLHGSIRNWFYETIPITAKLQQYISIISVWLTAAPDMNEGYPYNIELLSKGTIKRLSDEKRFKLYDNIKNGAQESIECFWSVMYETGYISKESEKSTECVLAIDLIAPLYTIKSEKERLIDFLTDPMRTKGTSLMTILEGCIVTMGYFWQKNVENMVQYYMKLYEEYLKAFDIIDKSRD